MEYRYAADIAVDGVVWNECPACGIGQTVTFIGCYFDCDKCGAKNVALHDCPTKHNHPMMTEGK